MSTLKVDALKSANGNSFILDVAQRNIIHNGNMTIAQRGTSNSGITSTGYYTVDRWETAIVTSTGGVGTWTQSQSTDTPEGTANTNGRFMHSLKMECTAAQATMNNTEALWIKQYIEGSSTDRFLYGTSSAKKSTLSFWVKSNKTGTYNVVWYNLNTSRDRQCIGRYTIDAADTWEKKSITIDADTFDYNPRGSTGDPGGGRVLRIHFVLASGSGRLNGTVSEGEWEAGDSLTWSHGQTVNLADTIGNTWYVTGVQYEVGENTTEFQYETFIENYMRCARHYQRISRDDTYPSSPTYTHGVYIGWGQFFSSTQAIIQWPTLVPFRFTPSVTYSDATHLSIIENGALTEPSTAIALYNDSSHVVERHLRVPYLLLTTAAAVSARIGRAFINNTAGWIALGDGF